MYPELRKYWFLLLGMLYIAYCALMWKWGHQGDMTFWLDWSNQIFNRGLTSIYDAGCNYMPLFLYFLKLHTLAQGDLIDIKDNLYTVKYYIFIFDILGAMLAVWFVKNYIYKIIFSLFLLLNVAYFYNSALWAQTDAIFSFFGFLALLLAIEKKPVLSLLSLVVALNFKLQALVFIPVVGLLLFPQFLYPFRLKKVILSLFSIAALLVLIYLPFILDGKMDKIYSVIFGSIDYYPHPTVGAFNLWSLLLPSTSIEGMYEITDDVHYGVLTYQQIGLLSFALFVMASIYPLVKYIFLKYFRKDEIVFPLEKVFLITAMVAIGFYFFNTQMHERYAHPALLSLATFSFLSGRYVALVLVSIAYFLNLERICWYLHLHHDIYMQSFVFDPKFVASIYLFAIAVMVKSLYWDKSQKMATVLEV